MKRRDFIALSAAISVAPALPAFASMADFIEYKPGLVTKSLKKGETVFLDFSAPWCSTCAAQARVIDTKSVPPRSIELRAIARSTRSGVLLGPGVIRKLRPRRTLMETPSGAAPEC